MSNQQQSQQSQYRCTLLKEVNQCPFYEEATGLCMKPDSDNDNQGMSNCAFKEHINTKLKDPYIRQKRWYEEFYENKRKASKQGKQSDNGKEPFPFT